MNKTIIPIGVISDTHGLLRHEAVEALAGSELIIHAGDVGDPDILETLEAIAPVRVVRGNVDRESWTQRFPMTDLIKVGSCSIYVVHDLCTMDIDASAADIDMVIFGHSHQPSIEQQHGVWLLNPGSAGPRRFDYPVSMAKVEVQGNQLQAEIVELVVQ
jgi:hypothetical protein